MFTTAVTSVLIMYALAGAISMLVAGLIKLLFVVLRRYGGGK